MLSTFTENYIIVKFPFRCLYSYILMKRFFLDVASLVRDAIKQMIDFNLVVSLDRPMNHMYVKNIKICLSLALKKSQI